MWAALALVSPEAAARPPQRGGLAATRVLALLAFELGTMPARTPRRPLGRHHSAWPHVIPQPVSTDKEKPSVRPRADPRRIAYRLLAVRPRSIEELRTRLRARGVESETVDELIRELTDLGLLDDALFARTVVESTIARKPVGRRWLHRKLRGFALPEALVESTLTLLLPREREVALAREAAAKKQAMLASGMPLLADVLRARLGRFLLGRGFASDITHEVLGTLEGVRSTTEESLAYADARSEPSPSHDP